MQEHIRMGLIAAGMIALSTPAFAAERIEAQAIEMSGWTFIPIVEDADTPAVTDDTLHSFVALLDPALIQGSRIAAIWYVKDAAAPGGWRGAAWATQDQWSVFGFLRDAYSMPEADAEYWATTQTRPSLIESASPPQAYRKGLFENDPLDEQVGPDDPDRQAMVEVLVQAGYEAANLKIEDMDMYADGEQVLGALETGVLAKRVNGLDPEAAANSQLATIFGSWCIPWTWEVSRTGWVGLPPATWSAPTASGGSGTTLLNCTYTRTYTQTQTRRLKHRFVSCQVTNIWETRTRTVTDSITCPDLNNALPCPPQPTCPGTIIPNPGSPGGWS